MEKIESEIGKNRFLIFLVHENGYPDNVLDIVATAQKHHRNVCYVCLNNTYDDMAAWMQSAGIDMNKFFFIDTLSSYYGKRKSTNSCFFVSSPSALAEIKYALSSAIRNRKCEAIIFDSISSLLEYGDMFSVLKFTHMLMTENKCAETRKIYIVLRGNTVPEEESSKLVTDLSMFADRVIET